MTSMQEDPVLQRKRLRQELKRLRLEANLTQAQVADHMGWSASKVIRIENGANKITKGDIRGLLGLYGVTSPDKSEGLVQLVSSTKEDPRADYKDVHSEAFLTYLGFERSAFIIREYDTFAVPGLLQIEEYNLALQRDSFGASEEVAEKRWAARLERQELHDVDKPAKMFFVIDEAVVHRVVGGPQVHARQLRRIIEHAERQHVALQVLPFSAGAQPSLGITFFYLEFRNPADNDVIFIESAFDVIERDDPELTAQFLTAFFQLEKAAMSEERTIEMLKSKADELESIE